MLHYNFPPFSVGEVGRLGSTGRREIGHGNLAERSIKNMMAPEAEFPYTVRIVSDILESNGSSSMATVCAATLALLDGGAPLKSSVAGIAMGLVKEGDRVAILSDILGNEDHLGDMDFKVAGTRKGITAFQMDIKIRGISLEIMRRALEQARDGRMHILGKMDEVIDRPRADLSPFAPRLTTLKIPVDMIGAVIGPGGKNIRQIVEDSGAEVNIEDDGSVVVAATSKESADKAIKAIMRITEVPGDRQDLLVHGEEGDGLRRVRGIPARQGRTGPRVAARREARREPDRCREGGRRVRREDRRPGRHGPVQAQQEDPAPAGVRAGSRHGRGEAGSSAAPRKPGSSR